MSLPKESETRKISIAKLTRSPIVGSPIPSPRNTPSFSNNQSFGKRFAETNSSSDSNVFMDDDDINEVGKYLNPDDSMSHEGGDITREIYKFIEPTKNLRTRSFSSSDLSSRRGSMANSINVPGGFRRDFLQSKAETRKANMLTRNFIEFLSIYGHFAGEDLEDEDYVACHYKPIRPKYFIDESSPLIDQLDPLDYSLVNTKGTATDLKAYCLLVKAFVGTGVLFLPKGFSNGGLIFLVICLLFFGFLSYWCYLILVFSKQATRVNGFAEIGLKLYGAWLQRLIFTSIVISQVGFISTYMVFTSTNLQAFMTNAFGIENIGVNWFIIGQLVILIPLSLIRDITRLSLTAVLANFLILFGLVTIIYYVLIDLFVAHHGQLGPGIEFWFNQREFSIFIGIAIFAFEGIGLIIPIQESMIYPNHFPLVLAKVVLTIGCIMIGIGTLGYITYGSSIETVILLNLPQNSYVVITIQLLYSIAILLSTPLQIFPTVRIIELKFFKTTGKHSTTIKWLKNLFRAVFVAANGIIAIYGGRNLNKFVSFVGCFACIPLVYMYPPMLHLRSCCDYNQISDVKVVRKRFWLTVLNYVLLVIGVFALVYTTYDLLR